MEKEGAEEVEEVREDAFGDFNPGRDNQSELPPGENDLREEIGRKTVNWKFGRDCVFRCSYEAQIGIWENVLTASKH